MSDTPEMDRLIARLCDNPERKLVNFHVSWGPGAHLLTAEERAKMINDTFDEVDSGRAQPIDVCEIDHPGFTKRLPDAVAECLTYNRMGGLDDTVMRDIAEDHDVPMSRLREALGWD